MTYCPDCVSFGVECSVDPEDYTEPCPYFKPRKPEEEDNEGGE